MTEQTSVTIKELEPFKSRKTIHQWLVDKKVRSPGKTKTGKRLIDFWSLPEDLQTRVQEARLVKAGTLVPTNPAPAPGAEAGSQTAAPHEGKLATHRAESTGQQQLSLLPQTPIDRSMAELKLRFAGAPSQADVAIKRYRIIEPLLNGDFRRRGYDTKSAYVAAIAAAEKCQQSTIYRWLEKYLAGGEDIAALTNDRPGPDPGTGAKLDASDRAYLKACFLGLPRADGVQRPPLVSRRACRAALISYHQSKQQAWGITRAYEIPSQATVNRYVKSIPRHEVILAREGEKAFHDKCGRYISRDPETLKSNSVWVTDQRMVDVRLRDRGEKLGRVWTVNFLDVRSWKWLGCWYGKVLSSDVVMRAAVMALARYGIPSYVHADHGKEFQCKAFDGGQRKIKGKTLFAEAEGLWVKLEVEVIRAIGDNPQAKIIERWHEEVAKFDKGFLGATGSNTDERPELTAELEAEHEAWLAGKARGTRLTKLGDYMERFVEWCENIWNETPLQGKYHRGMSPNQVYNINIPVGGLRMIPADQLEQETAERRRMKVARGGQINITLYGRRIEYEAPELFSQQGEEVLVLVSRVYTSSVEVYDAREKHICTAKLKPQFAWVPDNRDDLRDTMRKDRKVHREARHGSKQQRVLTECSNPMDVALATAEPANPTAARSRPRLIWNNEAAEMLRAAMDEAERPKKPARQQTSEELAISVKEMMEG
jgi:hypothetical protein